MGSVRSEKNDPFLRGLYPSSDWQRYDIHPEVPKDTRGCIG
jgi:hypothetical protein